MTVNNPFQEFFKGDTPTDRPEEKRVNGKIIKVSEDGWGFISSKEIKFTRIFFHWTSLKQDTLRFQDLKNGMHVEFTPVEVKDKGWRAIKIKVLDSKVTEPKETEIKETETKEQ